MSESPQKTLLGVRRLEMFCVAGLTLLAAIFRLLYLDATSLYADEINAIRTMTGERDLALSFGNGWLYWKMLRVVSWFGMSDFVFRLPSALIGAATIPLMYATATKLFGSRVGLFSALLLTAAPLHVYYSQYVHGYPLFCFLSLLSFYLLWRIYERGNTWDWAAFALVTGIGIQIHLYTFLVLGVEVIILIFLELSKQGTWSVQLLRKYFRKKDLLRLLMALGIVFLFALPTFFDVIVPLATDLVRKILGITPEEVYLAGPSQITITPRLFARALKELIVYQYSYKSIHFVSAMILLGVGMIYLLYRERRKGIPLLLWIGLPIVPIAYFSEISNLDFGTRRLIFILPMMLMVISVALVKLVDWVRGLLTRLRVKSVSTWILDGGLGVVVFLCISTSLIFYYRFSEPYDLKYTCQFLEQQVEPGDLVIGLHTLAHFSYYCSGALNMIDASTPLEEIQRRYQNSERIWYVRGNFVREIEWGFENGRYIGLELWIQEIEPLEFHIGPGMIMSFNRRQPESQRAMLEERAALLEKAIRVKPGRWYIHQALSNVYRELGRNELASKHRVLMNHLLPR